MQVTSKCVIDKVSGFSDLSYQFPCLKKKVRYSVTTFRKLCKGIRMIRTENIFHFTKDSSAIHRFNVLTFEIIELEAIQAVSNSLGALGFIFSFCNLLLHWGYTPLSFQRL